MNRNSDSQTPHRATFLLPRWSLETRVVLLLLAIALVRGVLYALINPPFSSPDEKGHYDYLASMLASGGSLLEGEEKHQPPLYYWLCLPLFAAFAGHTTDLQVYGLTASQVSIESLFAVRLLSVLMAVSTVPIAYWCARLICPDDRFVRLGTAALVALIPAYGWLGASINNDNLAALLSSGSIAMMLLYSAHGFSPARLVGLLLLVGAGMAAKPTTWPIAAMALAVPIARLASRWVSWRQFVATLLTLLVLVTALLVSPAGGVLLGPLELVVKRWGNSGTLSGEKLATFLGNLDSRPFVYQFESFWGSFVTDSIQLPSFVYLGLGLLTAVAAVGLIFRLLGAIARQPGPRRIGEEGRARVCQVAILVSLVLIEWGLSFFRFYANEPLRPDQRIAGWEDDLALMQGRFLFPAIIPIAFLLAWGLAAVLPPRMRKHAPLMLAACLIVVDGIALATLAYGGNAWRVYPASE